MSSVTGTSDLVFDVGMHRGEDTAFYLALGYRVVAFEADPKLADGCRVRFSEQIADGRLTIVEGAIAASAERSVRFFRNAELTMWGTTDGDWATRRDTLVDFEAIDVPVIDFADCLDEFGVPYYLKIDIEGADKLCLEALLDRGERPRYASIESEKFSFAALEAEFDLLDQLGYRRFAVVQQASIPGKLIRTTSRDGIPIEYRFERDASGSFGGDVGPWLDREAALNRYRSIFRSYRMFGETSPMRRVRLGRVMLARLPRYVGRSLPGWYDTHAMLAD